MKKNKGKDKNSVFLVIGVLLVVGIITVGYAALSATLSINGTANIGGATWDIHFETIEETDNTNVEATQEPEASGDDTTELTYQVSLTKPGDIYQFTADIVNDGTLDAKLDSLRLEGNTLNYVNYTVTYENGDPIEEDDSLLAGSSVTILVTVQYDRSAVDDDDLSEEPIPLDLSADFDYVQA